MVSVADVRWQGVNLAVLSWPEKPELGDEQLARHVKKPQDLSKDSLAKWRQAARAYRQLSKVMRDQGMSEEADRFAYHGNVCQRQLYSVQGKYLRQFGSWLLDLVSGYGYKPLRSLFTYLLVVLGFATAYFFLTPITGVHFEPLGAVVFSVTSFHGRGFSPGETVALTNLVTVIAAGEAVIGLLIEITFIATFIQRFFAR
jgi:hypothetical protein